MDVNFIQQVPQTQTLNAPATYVDKSSTQLPKSQVVQAATKTQEQETQLNADRESRRQAMVQQAANKFKDFFPINDISFTIFKDSSGQYITRFTSLRDGKVTYIPEQNMFTLLHRSGSTYENNLKINA